MYVLVYMLSIVVFDSWNLLTHETVLQRWTLAGVFLVINTIIWYLCKIRFNNQNIYKMLIVLLLLVDILFAAVNVYWQRGMASKAVILFTVPIISAAVVRSRSLLLAITSLSGAAYSIACVRYFYENYGQGYRVELYGELAMYVGIYFVLTWLLMINFQPSKD